VFMALSCAESFVFASFLEGVVREGLAFFLS
jgi:hypothetical protein